MDANALWLSTHSFSALSEMVLKRGCVLLVIGYAMRVLCCLLLGVSVSLSGCGESKEDAAVAAIENLGGEVGFEGKIFGKPVSVSFDGRRVTDAGLVHLKELMSLHTLNLSGTKVTGAGLERLKEMTSLRALILQKTNVTTAGAQDLQAALPKCKISR
jgi:hypothetical protein